MALLTAMTSVNVLTHSELDWKADWKPSGKESVLSVFFRKSFHLSKSFTFSLEDLPLKMVCKRGQKNYSFKWVHYAKFQPSWQWLEFWLNPNNKSEKLTFIFVVVSCLLFACSLCCRGCCHITFNLKFNLPLWKVKESFPIFNINFSKKDIFQSNISPARSQTSAYRRVVSSSYNCTVQVETLQ